jgi:hypothetical protein
MLNDLLLLQAGARRMGIAPAIRHPQVQAPGRTTAIQVRLDEAGGIVALEVLPSDRMAQLWTFGDGNHNRFPFVQMKVPLLGVERGSGLHELFEDEPLEPGDRRRELAAAVRGTNDWPEPFSTKLVERCEARCEAIAEIDPASSCVPEVLRRGIVAMRDPDFLRRLAEAILHHEAKGLLGSDGLALATAALVGQRKAKAVEGATFYFDVAPGFGGGRRGQSTTDVTDGRSVHAPSVAAALAASTTGAASGICGLTGERAPLHEGPFPKPTLRVVGGAYIYARNVDATRAALRYGNRGTYPIRAELPPLLAGTIEELTEAGREGASWRSVPSERAKESDLLIAAVEVDARIALADALAGGAASGDAAEEGSSVVEQVVKALEAKLADLPPGEEPQATLLLLRKIDPGNVKAVLSRRLSADALRHAAQRWIEAQRNAPPMRLKVRTKDRGERTHHPYRLAPLQLPAVTRATFIRGGTERAARPAPGLRPQDALALFLGDESGPRIAAGALSMILRRQGGLLIETAHILRRGGASGADNVAALRAVGAFGLLLKRLGRDKEDYMTENAYRLGQLFAAADAVHAGYCADVRKGAMPPTLLGNEILGVAQRSPVKGLDLMGRRIKPYEAWARRRPAPAPVGKDDNLPRREALLRDAYWGIRHIERLCRTIDRERLAEIPDDVARAEMILGYLAGPYEPKAKGAPEATGQNEEGDDA